MTTKLRQHVLAIDIGGTHVKLRTSNRREVREFDSSPGLLPRELVRRVGTLVKDWRFSRISIGFPCMVIDGRIVSEPVNLGHGWVNFDFERAFGKPVMLLNDAVMQAIGSYTGGRMLYLGFGTGLGAVAVLNGRLFPMELAHLPFTKRGLVQSYVGGEALRRLGIKRWSANARSIMHHFSRILDIDYLVAGGGNGCRIIATPKHVRIGHNDLAFVGGFRAWRPAFGVKV